MKQQSNVSIKLSPEKSVVYLNIQLFNPSQERKKLHLRRRRWRRQLMMCGLGLPDETKATQSYKVLTHAGSRLQSNKGLAPCTLALMRVWKFPDKSGETKSWGLSSEPKDGRTKRVRIGPSEGIFSLKKKQSTTERINPRYKQSFFRAYTQKVGLGSSPARKKKVRVWLEEGLFVFDEHLHHLPLVAHVVQRCDGVHVGRTH